jgi:hypothetical protein
MRGPAGFAGGINLYAYVDGSPTNLVDPLGLESGNLNVLVPGPTGEVATNAPAPGGGTGSLAGRKLPINEPPYPLIPWPKDKLREAEEFLRAMSELEHAVEFPIVNRVLVPVAMVTTGGVVMAGGVATIAGGCATVLGCAVALPVGGMAIVGGGFLSFEGIVYGVTGTMYDPSTGTWVRP